MKVYEEIIFLKGHATCKWIVENVRPYYQLLIAPTAILQRHFFRSNFAISKVKIAPTFLRNAQMPELLAHHGFDRRDFAHPRERQYFATA